MEEGRGTINVKVNKSRKNAKEAAEAVEQKLVDLQERERQIEGNIFPSNICIYALDNLLFIGEREGAPKDS